MKYKSEFLSFIQERGYLYQCTDADGLDRLLLQNDFITAYIGFDCTMPSLHIGHLIQIMILRHLQKFGHKPILLLGGSTTKIGDPSGKDGTRSFLSITDINLNMLSIKKTLEKIVLFNDLKNSSIIVNNADWLDDLKYINFLRNVGIYFSVNRMLNFDSVKMRLDRERNLSFLEFNYMLLQAYDFTELYKKYGCRLQIGGSDQWGNIVSGVELGKRLSLPKLFGLTAPLLLNRKGKKMCKTENGAVWLDSNILSSYEYWQYFRNIKDQDVGFFLRLFTDLPINEIKKLESLKNQEINEAKKILATEATKICRGEKEAEIARSTAVSAFENKDNLLLPSYFIKREQVINSLFLTDIICYIVGFTSSKSAAKRLILNGGCKINDVTIKNVSHKISLETFKDKRHLKLSFGRKHHIKLEITW